ncbi:MAG: SDR family NAD(P)-dependent oxidoreductase [Anaerolineae bacterium]|nr:SDR family oxidoreductase [Thermoflexales bacterium]MDW8406543.1 SDR family NAD(P)-dependent oxidoreductase [Anaerolineae bacterium]
MSNLTGKVAVVTGSTGGMGEGIARRLAQAGASVVVSGRRVEHGERVTREIASIGAPCVFVRADVGEEADCVALIRATVEQFGRIDILVNNAAATPVEPAGQQSAELWDHVFAVNTRGPWICTREAIPFMRRQGGGNIVNIGSTMGYRGWLDRLAYATSKAALLAMTRTLARELAPDRIRVNWITVGWVATPNEIDLRTKTHGDGAAYLSEMNSKAIMGRLETVEDIAEGVAYLVSEQAAHVTGCELNISGGMFVHT